MSLQAPQFLTSSEVPKESRVVAALDERPLAVRRERDRGGPRCNLETPQHSATGQIPQPGSQTQAPNERLLAVRRERHRVDSLVVPFQALQFPAGGEVPELDRVNPPFLLPLQAGTCRERLPAIWREHDRVD